MSDETTKMTVSRPVEPVTVAVIGQGDTTRLTTGAVAVTANSDAPDLVVQVVQPARAIAVRFANSFLTAFGGLVVAGITPAGEKLLYTKDFMHLLFVCASLALPGACVGLIKDLITVFGRLENKYPLATGNV